MARDSPPISSADPPMWPGIDTRRDCLSRARRRLRDCQYSRGGEYGHAWNEAGLLEKKQNVFDGFVAAAEYLVREGYASPRRSASSAARTEGYSLAL